MKKFMCWSSNTAFPTFHICAWHSPIYNAHPVSLGPAQYGVVCTLRTGWDQPGSFHTVSCCSFRLLFPVLFWKFCTRVFSLHTFCLLYFSFGHDCPHRSGSSPLCLCAQRSTCFSLILPVCCAPLAIFVELWSVFKLVWAWIFWSCRYSLITCLWPLNELTQLCADPVQKLSTNKQNLTELNWLEL